MGKLLYKCHECGKEKNKDSFPKREIEAAYYKLPKCKDCISHTSWACTIKTKYNLTVEEYEDLLIEQLGVCAICKRRQKGTKLAVDHCHTTGKIRGLLCLNCNTALGSFQDNEKTLLQAIEYLRKSRE